MYKLNILWWKAYCKLLLINLQFYIIIFVEGFRCLDYLISRAIMKIIKLNKYTNILHEEN